MARSSRRQELAQADERSRPRTKPHYASTRAHLKECDLQRFAARVRDAAVFWRTGGSPVAPVPACLRCSSWGSGWLHQHTQADSDRLLSLTQACGTEGGHICSVSCFRIDLLDRCLGSPLRARILHDDIGVVGAGACSGVHVFDAETPADDHLKMPMHPPLRKPLRLEPLVLVCNLRLFSFDLASLFFSFCKDDIELPYCRVEPTVLGGLHPVAAPFRPLAASSSVRGTRDCGAWAAPSR